MMCLLSPIIIGHHIASDTEKVTKPLASHEGYKHSPDTNGKEVNILLVIILIIIDH